MKSVVVSILIFLGPIFSYSQTFQLGMGGGISIYNGDLSHHNPLMCLSESNPAWTVSAGLRLNDVWTIQGSYSSTLVEGSDKTASNQELRMRNLHFYSDINEFALTTSFYFLPVFEVPSKIVKPYIFGGFGIFHFNPKADYQGQSFELQKLSTEGQGLPGSKKSPYQLIETNLQLGIGIDFQIRPCFSIGLYSGVRFLQTDYLDDVSGTYYDLNLLGIYKGPDAASLAYRSHEISNDKPDTVVGISRGNPKNNDSYLLHQLKFTYSFN